MLRKHLFLLAVVLMILATAGDAIGSNGGKRRSAGKSEEIEGVIVAVSQQWITIRTAKRGDLVVRIAPETVVSVDDRRVSVSVLQIGDEVEARIGKDQSGLYTAISIEIETESEAWGVVKSISERLLVITTGKGDLTVQLTPFTVVVFDDHVASVGAISPGMRVEVEWVRGPDGSRLALVIEVDLDPVEIEGVVTHVDATSIRVRTRNGNEVTVRVTPDTRVRRDDRHSTVAMLYVGAGVEIEALRGSDGTLTALLIEIDDDDLLEIEGVVTAVGSDFLRIQTRSGEEITVAVPPGAVVRADGRLRSLSDLRPGDRVEIKVQVNAAGELIAVVVEIEDEDERFFELEGNIVSIIGSRLTIRTEGGREVTVWITSETIIRGDDSIVDVSQLRAGDEVEVVVRRRPDGSLEAVAIEVEEDDDDDSVIEIEGRIAAVVGNQITVETRRGSVTVIVNDQTVIKKDDRRGSLADLRPGLRVEVKAVHQSDGGLLAKIIEIDDDDDDEHDDD